MGQSTLSGPVRIGTEREGATANLGHAVISQTTLMDQNSTNNVDFTFYVPANAQLADFLVDTLTAFNSVTSATLTIGTTAGGTTYASGVDVKVAGRVRPTFTAAQLAAMDDVGTTTTVVVRIAPVGATSAGQVRVTAIYVQK